MDRPASSLNTGPSSSLSSLESIPDPNVPAPSVPNAQVPVPSVSPSVQTVPVVRSVSSGLNNALSGFNSAVSERTTRAWSKGKELFVSSSTKVIVYATLGLVITVAIAVWLYFIITSYALGQKMVVLPETAYALLGTHQTVASGSNIPGTGNGQRLTFAFWIYINNMATYANLYRHVLHRGDSGILMSSPLVYIDKNTNKLVVRFETSSATAVTGQPTSMAQPFITTNNIVSTTDTNAAKYSGYDADSNSDENKILLDLLTRGITVDYIPLQRWVHIAIVVNEQSSQGTVSAYVDAELVKVLTSQQTTYINVTDSAGVQQVIQPTYSFQNMVLDKGGNVYVGGNPLDPNVGPGFDGLVSCVTFANYDMNAKNVYDLYMRGPTGNMLSKIGYGLRSPIYKLN